MKDAPPDALHRHIAKEAFDGQVDFTAIPHFVCDAPYWCDSHSSEAARTAKPVNPKMMLRDFWRTTLDQAATSRFKQAPCVPTVIESREQLERTSRSVNGNEQGFRKPQHATRAARRAYP